jgi:acetoin utilization deacetylase AcuC-like enzyme
VWHGISAVQIFHHQTSEVYTDNSSMMAAQLAPWEVTFVLTADQFPKDQAARAGIEVEVQLRDGCTSEEYMQKLHQSLDSAFSQFEPHLVIHNAGSDILASDPLGKCAATST